MAWLWAVVGAITVAVWAAVLVAHRIRRVPHQRRERHQLTLSGLVVLAWAYSFVPPMLGLLQLGRQSPRFGQLVPSTATQVAVSTILAATVAVLCCYLILTNIGRQPAVGMAVLGAFLSPWFLIQVVPGVASSYLAGPQLILYPLLAIAFWLTSPSLSLLSTLGYTVAATAGFSLVLGVATPLGLVDMGLAGTEKALLTSGPELLAGPYNHSNSLGLVLALGSPAVLAIPRRAVRLTGLGAVTLAVVWSSSRTSVLALAVILGLYSLIRYVRAPHLRLVGGALFLAGAALAAYIPFRETDPFAFSQRGAVWIASQDIWREHLWLGAGPKYYERANDLGFYALYGHNLPIDMLIRGGLVAAVGMTVFVACLLLRALKLVPITPIPLLALIGLAYASLLEVPLLFDNLGILGFVTWLPLALIAFTRDRSHLSFVMKPSRERAPALS